jgi:hypothetical protein
MPWPNKAHTCGRSLPYPRRLTSQLRELALIVCGFYARVGRPLIRSIADDQVIVLAELRARTSHRSVRTSHEEASPGRPRTLTGFRLDI